MMRFVMLLCLLFTLPLSHAEQPVVAGTVQQLQGAALANHASSSSNLAREAPVYVGDRLVTGRNARVVLTMVDGSVLTLGENTEFVISAYRYSAAQKQGTARLELLRGVFRAITGAIGKLPERDFTVRTATATIGIRGTDFWGGFMFTDALDVALLGGGGIYIENAAGRVEISQSGFGTTVKAADQSPSKPIRWGNQKLAAAVQSVTLDGPMPRSQTGE